MPFCMPTHRKSTAQLRMCGLTRGSKSADGLAAPTRFLPSATPLSFLAGASSHRWGSAAFTLHYSLLTIVKDMIKVGAIVDADATKVGAEPQNRLGVTQVLQNRLVALHPSQNASQSGEDPGEESG
jgi:hypothetical protein